MRECKKDEITIEKLLEVVHSYTDPVRIIVIMGDAQLKFAEANYMHDFRLTDHCRWTDTEEVERLMKYYKDVPVWNLTVWVDGPVCTDRGRTFFAGIEARCHYEDIREAYLREKEDLKRERKREANRRYREKQKEEEE